MKMNKLVLTEKMVEHLLEKYPRTRTSDHLLYRAYHYELVKQHAIAVDFETFFTHPEDFKASNFSTIERCRRTIQHYRPELANKETKLNREYLQQVFKDYAIKGGETK